MKARMFVAVAVGVSASALAYASGDDGATRGRVFVEDNCSVCHATGASGPSPNLLAPRFRDLHELYPVESLGEALAEGIVTGHPEMPQFTLDPRQIEDVIVYLKTLEMTSPD